MEKYGLKIKETAVKTRSRNVSEVVSKGNTNFTDQPAATWELTLNNYVEKDIEWLKTLEFSRMVVSKEVGENGTPHLQGKVTWKRGYRLGQLHKLHPRIHWEPSVAKEEWNYANKIDSVVVIDVNNKKQGQRTDLNFVKEEIMLGKSVDQIALETPMTYHQYGRTLEKLEDIKNKKIWRHEMTSGTWYHGKTGTGKSHVAFHEYNPETCYLWTNDKGWWDGYEGQETVIMNDFRGEIPYNMMLQLIDKYPMNVPRRNRKPAPFISKNIIITSSLHPKKIYHNRDEEDDIEQLIRRVKVIELSENPIALALRAPCKVAKKHTSNEQVASDLNFDTSCEM